MDFLDSIDSDFSAIIAGEFSEPCTITQGLNAPISARGIFDENYLEIDPDTQTEVMSKNPRIQIFQKILGIEIKQGDTITVRGKTYTAHKPQPDGQGSILVRLHNAA